MLIDSVATVNLLDSAAFDNLLNKPCLKKSNTKTFPYMYTTPLTLNSRAGLFRVWQGWGEVLIAPS